MARRRSPMPRIRHRHQHPGEQKTKRTIRLLAMVLTISSQNRKEAIIAIEMGFEPIEEVDPGETQSLGAITVTMIATVLVETAQRIAEGGRRGRKRKRRKKNGVPNERSAIDANEEKEGDPIRRPPRHRHLYQMMHRSRHLRSRIGKEKRKGGETRDEKDTRRPWITIT